MEKSWGGHLLSTSGLHKYMDTRSHTAHQHNITYTCLLKRWIVVLFYSVHIHICTWTHTHVHHHPHHTHKLDWVHSGVKLWATKKTLKPFKQCSIGHFGRNLKDLSPEQRQTAEAWLRNLWGEQGLYSRCCFCNILLFSGKIEWDWIQKYWIN